MVWDLNVDPGLYEIFRDLISNVLIRDLVPENPVKCHDLSRLHRCLLGAFIKCELGLIPAVMVPPVYCRCQCYKHQKKFLVNVECFSANEKIYMPFENE